MLPYLFGWGRCVSQATWAAEPTAWRCLTPPPPQPPDPPPQFLTDSQGVVHPPPPPPRARRTDGCPGRVSPLHCRTRGGMQSNGEQEGAWGVVGRHWLSGINTEGGGSGSVLQPGWVGQKFGIPPPSYSYGLGGWVPLCAGVPSLQASFFGFVLRCNPVQYRCGCGALLSNVDKAECEHGKSERHKKWLKSQQTTKTLSAFFVKKENRIGGGSSSGSGSGSCGSIASFYPWRAPQSLPPPP